MEDVKVDEITYGGELVPVEATIEPAPHDGEVTPKRGTAAWVVAQGTVELAGEQVPACHRIPEDASLAEADGGKCRVTYASGERCKAAAVRVLGLCMGHAGGGGTVDVAEMSAKGRAAQTRLKATRQLLGISAKRTGDPRMAARLRASQRADDIALAIVDGPLDADISAVERQRAALAALDATFPQQAASLSIEIEDVDSMSWQDMQRLASSLLG
jgi:hypothetical protein